MEEPSSRSRLYPSRKPERRRCRRQRPSGLRSIPWQQMMEVTGATLLLQRTILHPTRAPQLVWMRTSWKSPTTRRPSLMKSRRLHPSSCRRSPTSRRRRRRSSRHLWPARRTPRRRSPQVNRRRRRRRLPRTSPRANLEGASSSRSRPSATRRRPRLSWRRYGPSSRAARERWRGLEKSGPRRFGSWKRWPRTRRCSGKESGNWSKKGERRSSCRARLNS
mmetsp:Transcript_24345/g.68460  ORF Transcript_24345/g.68460 Transcript_24345/m.68460 type:complete len:220 (-) Transcript_24345:3156-3815(-)